MKGAASSWDVSCNGRSPDGFLHTDTSLCPACSELMFQSLQRAGVAELVQVAGGPLASWPVAWLSAAALLTQTLLLGGLSSDRRTHAFTGLCRGSTGVGWVLLAQRDGEVLNLLGTS